MDYHEAVSVTTLFKPLFDFSSTAKLDYGLLYFAIFTAFLTQFLPYFENIFKRNNRLASNLDKSSTLNFLASNLHYLTYPPYRPDVYNISVLSLIRTIKQLNMMASMVFIMGKKNALYFWTYILSTTIFFSLMLYLEPETALGNFGVC